MLNSTLLEEMQKRFNEIAPISFIYERGTEHSKHMSEELKKAYIGENPSADSLVKGIGKVRRIFLSFLLLYNIGICLYSSCMQTVLLAIQ